MLRTGTRVLLPPSALLAGSQACRHAALRHEDGVWEGRWCLGASGCSPSPKNDPFPRPGGGFSPPLLCFTRRGGAGGRFALAPALLWCAWALGLFYMLVNNNKKKKNNLLARSVSGDGKVGDGEGGTGFNLVVRRNNTRNGVWAVKKGGILSPP